MRTSIFAACLALLLAAGTCKGQPARIFLAAEKETTIKLFGTVDGAFQPFHHALREFTLTPGQTLAYDLEVTDFSFLQLASGYGQRCFLLLFPGDSVVLTLSDYGFDFSGTNAAGHRYYDTYWNSTAPFIAAVQEAALTCEDYTSFTEVFADRFVVITERELDSLATSGAVTARFAETLRRDITQYQYSVLLNTLNALSLNKTLSETQMRQVNALIGKLYGQITQYDDIYSLRLYLGSYYIRDKYRHMYEQLPITEQELLGTGYPTAAFGPYKHYLLAPAAVQIPEFFSAILAEYDFSSTLFGYEPLDIPALLAYMEKIAPGSESAAIIASLERQRKGRATEHARDDGEIRYVTDEIETLAEIVSLPGLCGRYCLIDLWASWCIPCRQQFRFTEQLHEITARYDNLQLVYISIDKPETADRWTKAVEKHALAGWHIRAGQSLLEDITQKVYQNRNITIPRYILLAPSGEIVCPDLPRPNRYEALAAALASCLEDEGQ